MQTIQIVLVRHAHSRWQEDHAHELDSGLSDRGVAQALRLAEWLATCPEMHSRSVLRIGAIYSSPMVRALSTAQPSSDRLQIPVSTSIALREAAFHVESEMPPVQGPTEPTLLGGHSDLYESFRAQVRAALEELVKEALDRRAPIMVFTHQGVVRAILHLLSGSETLWFRILNTGITTLEWREDRWRVGGVNLTDHLPARLRTY